MSPWDPDGRGPRSGRCVTRAQTSILIRPLGSRSRAAWGRQGLLPDGIGGTPLSLPWWPDRVVGWTPLHPPPGRDPRAPKTGQIRASRGPNFSGFLGPCGAAPRGGGGAPPTTLILLRNQWSAYREIVAPAHPRPAGGPGSSAGPAWPVWPGQNLISDAAGAGRGQGGPPRHSASGAHGWGPPGPHPCPGAGSDDGKGDAIP